MIELTPETVAVKLAGVAGALVSMQFLQGTRTAKFLMAVCGSILSYYLTPYVSTKLGLPEGPAGFLLGLFGMAVASRAWQFVNETPIASIWKSLLNWLIPGKKETADKEAK